MESKPQEVEESLNDDIRKNQKTFQKIEKLFMIKEGRPRRKFPEFMKQTHEEAISWCRTVKEMGQTEIDILIEEGWCGEWLVDDTTTKDDLEERGFEETKAEALIEAIKKRQAEEE